MRLSMDHRRLHIMRHVTVTDRGPLVSFPLHCPHCRCAAGFPCYASTIRGSSDTIRIGLRCRDCQGEWTMQMKSTDGILRLIAEADGT